MLTREKFINRIVNLCLEINTKLPTDVSGAIEKASENESNELAKKILIDILKNNKLSNKTKLPMCQDTGVCVYLVNVGRNADYDFDLGQAINEATEFAYKTFYFRSSIVNNPIERINTKTNTPVIIHYEICDGSNIEISLAAKGAGSENMSTLKMLPVSGGVNAIKEFVCETIKNAGGKACPPLSIGIGLGGSFEYCAVLAKKALYKSVNESSKTPHLKKLEQEILKEVNSLKVGPMGYGGDTTCISVKILEAPCHIASLPCAVNLNCHAARHQTITLKTK